MWIPPDTEPVDLSDEQLDSTAELAPHAHVFVARCGAHLEGAGARSTGDAARPTGTGPPTLVGGSDGAEVLIWASA